MTPLFCVRDSDKS